MMRYDTLIRHAFAARRGLLADKRVYAPRATRYIRTADISVDDDADAAKGDALIATRATTLPPDVYAIAALAVLPT